MNTRQAQKPGILVGALHGGSGVLASPSSTRGWLGSRLAALSLLAALFFVLSLPTSVMFTVARDVLPVGQDTYLIHQAHHSQEQIQHVGGVRTPISPVTHRIRGALDKSSVNTVPRFIVSLESYAFPAEIAQKTPRPLFTEPRPTYHFFPQALLSRPPPVR
jgi:hypothetical protein